MSEEQGRELTRRESLNQSRSETKAVRRRRVLKDRIQAVGFLLLVIVLPLAIFVIIPSSMGAYDRTHHRTMECTVEKIYSESTSTRSGKGIGASGRHIIFKTSDCRGHLILEKGVYWDNVKELTKSLKPGRYRITVGEAEWNLTPFYRVFKVSPTIQKYEYLSRN